MSTAWRLGDIISHPQVPHCQQITHINPDGTLIRNNVDRGETQADLERMGWRFVKTTATDWEGGE